MILRDITESRRTAQQTIESERLNALTLLAAGVAHEIGNPLNSLHIHLQLMERKAQDCHDAKAELQQSIDVARSEVRGSIPLSRNSCERSGRRIHGCIRKM